jgi:anti-sigma regulatory factor (Ser/Thr protein kinase)
MPQSPPRVAAERAPLASTLTLDLDMTQVARARQFVRDHCHRLGFDSDTCDTAVLLASEAVTNAFTHGHSGARIVVKALPGRLLVEVGDDNSRHPQVLEPDPNALDGRGVTLIAALAARWGVRSDELGKVVWFEIFTAAAPAGEHGGGLAADHVEHAPPGGALNPG